MSPGETRSSVRSGSTAWSPPPNLQSTAWVDKSCELGAEGVAVPARGAGEGVAAAAAVTIVHQPTGTDLGVRSKRPGRARSRGCDSSGRTSKAVGRVGEAEAGRAGRAGEAESDEARRPTEAE